MVCCRWIVAIVLLWANPVFVRGESFGSKAGDTIRTDLFGDPLPKGAIARMGTARFRGGIICNLLWTPDGKTLISGGFINNPIRLWDVASGKEIRRLTECDNVLALSPDGKTLASGWYDEISTIHLWDAASGNLIRCLDGDHYDGVESLAWSPDGKSLASGGNNNTIHLWNPATGKEIRRLIGHTNSVRSVAWSPDGRWLASGSFDKTIRLWQVVTGKEIRRFVGHKDSVYTAAWSSDGKTLVSSSEDKTVRFWDVATRKEIRRLDGASSPAWSPDGRIMALRYGEETRLWEPTTGKVLRTLAGKRLSSVVWSPDGKVLASIREEAIHLWDASTGEEIRPREGHDNSVNSLCWSPDGKVVASASDDKTIRLWDAATGKGIRTLEGHISPICSLCWSPDSQILASGSEFIAYYGARPDEKTIRLWDPATGKEIRHLTGHKGDVRSLAWSPDGKTLASGSDDKSIRLWDVASRKEIRRIASDTDEIRMLAWSPDGKKLASIGQDKTSQSGSKDNTIRLFEAATGKEIRRLIHENKVSLAAWSPDGGTLASTSEGNIILWAAATGKPIRRFDAQADEICWSPDGKTLASASGEDTIRLWEAATWKEIRRLAGHQGYIRSLAWSPDGRRLASAGYDTTLLIWAIGYQSDDPPLHLSSSQLKTCWMDLIGEDAAKAYQAIRILIRGAEESVPYLAEWLQPVSPADPQRIVRLIKELDSDRFAVRQQATNELKQLEERAEAAMRRALANHPTLESRKRLEHLLAELDIWSGERLRALRAIMVLENIATAEARRVLEALAHGDAAARLTQEAKASLRRLDVNRKSIANSARR